MAGQRRKRSKTAQAPAQKRKLWFKSLSEQVFSIDITEILLGNSLDFLHELIIRETDSLLEKGSYGFSLTKPGSIRLRKEKKYYHTFTEISSVIDNMSEANPLCIEEEFPVNLDGANPDTSETVTLWISFKVAQSFDNFLQKDNAEIVLSEQFNLEFPSYQLQVVTPLERGFKDIIDEFDCTLTCNSCHHKGRKSSTLNSNALSMYVSAANHLSETNYIRDLKSYLLSDSSTEVVDENGSTRTRCSQTFSAIMSPEMTGKTQIALSLGSGAFYLNFNSQSENIYKAFDHICSDLIDFAKMDVDQFLRKDYLANDRSKSRPNNFITRTMIKQKFDTEGKESFLCGFINYLIDKFSDRILGGCKVEEWIKGLTDLRSSKINALNTTVLSEKLKEGSRKKILFILDEFPSANEFYWKEAMFVRNFLRYMNISCLLIGTSAHINNLIGTTSRSDYSFDGYEPFGDLLIKLPQTDINIITSNYDIGKYFARCGYALSPEDSKAIVTDAINASMDCFCQVWFNKLDIKDEWGKRIVRFFKVFVDQIKTSRPGISVCIGEQMANIELLVKVNSEDSSLEFANLLTFAICETIIERNPILASEDSINGHFAMSVNLQIEQDVLRSELIKNFVDNHLYNLQINPDESNCSIILDGAKSGIRLYSKKSFHSFSVRIAKTGHGDRSIRATFPPPSEELLAYFTACWGFDTKNATLPVLRKSIGFPMPSFLIYENLVELYQLSDCELSERNFFDVLCNTSSWKSGCITPVSLLLASHRDSLFKVMNGNVYINNLLSHFKDFKTISDVTASCSELKAFLDRLIAPYLGPSEWGDDLLKAFPSMFGKLNRFDESDYKKFYFEVFVNGSPFVCIVDCVPGDESLEDGLQSLIEQSYQNARNVKSTCALHLVFCFDNFSSECFKEKQALQRYITEKRRGVFLAKFTDGTELIPLFRDPFQFDSVTIVIPIYSELFA